MNKRYKEIQQELKDLYEEYDSHYEASRDIMAQINMAESELIQLEEEDDVDE